MKPPAWIPIFALVGPACSTTPNSGRDGTTQYLPDPPPAPRIERPSAFVSRSPEAHETARRLKAITLPTLDFDAATLDEAVEVLRQNTIFAHPNYCIATIS